MSMLNYYDEESGTEECPFCHRSVVGDKRFLWCEDLYVAIGCSSCAYEDEPTEGYICPFCKELEPEIIFKAKSDGDIIGCSHCLEWKDHD